MLHNNHSHHQHHLNQTQNHNHNHNRRFSIQDGPLNDASEQEQLTYHHHHHHHQQHHHRRSSRSHSHSYSHNNAAHQPHHDAPLTPAQVSPTRVSPASQRFSSTAQDTRITPLPPPRARYHPSAHPDSKFRQPGQARNTSRDSSRHRRSSSSWSAKYQDYSPASPIRPSPHRRRPVGQPAAEHLSGQDLAYAQPLQLASLSAADMDDNLADRQVYTNMARPGADTAPARSGNGGIQSFPGFEATSSRRSYIPSDASPPSTPSEPADLSQRPTDASRYLRQQGSYSSSTLPIAAGGATPGSMTPILPVSDGFGQSFPLSDYQSHQLPAGQSPYHDSPYQNSSFHLAPQVSQANINPLNIADDGDDGFMPDPKRRSVLGTKGPSTHEAGASAAAGGAVGGGIWGALGGLAGRKQKAQTSSAAYDPLAQSGNARSGSAEPGSGAEKSEWLSRQTKGNNKLRWVVGLVLGLVIVLAITGGIVGGVLGSRSAASNSSGAAKGSPGASTNNADDDTAANGDLNKDSAEIKALMNNADLHKVFPAMDYTPWGMQYPLCLTYPPSQNNITRDMAVLSQLTNTVRLYGTDCNQTEMVVHSIDRLGLSAMKVWLGVWIDTNTTTNARQLDQMYKILEDVSDHSIFKGVIVGNEALYRAGVDKAASQENLIEILTEVRSNFTSLQYDLPVATSDLGDNWNEELVQASDMVMSNIHPFFAGVPVDEAAGWTYNFWQTKDVSLTEGSDKPQIISETGWPSGGGNDCGTLDTECPTPESGSVAGVDEMNIFMGDFVCQALENGTDYFWFEAFDEPWKVAFNAPGEEWEDKWGLMDPARKLKPGLEIPDCGGRTAS